MGMARGRGLPRAHGPRRRAKSLPENHLYPSSKDRQVHHHRYHSRQLLPALRQGALLHSAGPTHDWAKPIAFTVPVSGDKIVLAVRAINRYADIGLWQPSPAGLRAAVEVRYQDGTSSGVSYTGQDGSWMAERLFPEGWEQPGFDDRRWKPAKVMPNVWATGPVWRQVDRPHQALIGSTLPLVNSTSSQHPSTLPGVHAAVTPVTTRYSGLGANAISLQNAFSSGEYAGFAVGLCLGAVLASTILTFVFSRRRFREGKEW